MGTVCEDYVESVDHPGRPCDGEKYDHQQQGDGDVVLLTGDALPLVGRVQSHADSMTAHDRQRQRVTDGDHDHRHCVARHDDNEEVDERRYVGRISRPALGSPRLVDDVRQ